MGEIELPKTEKPTPKWVWATVLGFSALFLAGMVFRIPLTNARRETSAADATQAANTRQAMQPATTPPVAQTPDSSSSQTSDAQIAAAPAENTPPQGTTPSKSNNCHDNDMFATYMHPTAQTREQFADEKNARMNEKGPSWLTVLTAGDDKEYLLFVAAPGDAESLEGFAEGVKNPSDRANFCLNGFAEVQFIVRDQNSNQTLVDKFQTDPGKTFVYLNQRYGAKPMQ